MSCIYQDLGAQVTDHSAVQLPLGTLPLKISQKQNDRRKKTNGLLCVIMPKTSSRFFFFNFNQKDQSCLTAHISEIPDLFRKKASARRNLASERFFFTCIICEYVISDENGQTSRTGEAKSSIVNLFSCYNYIFCNLKTQLLRLS